MSREIQCPECGWRPEDTDAAAGQKLTCPQCRRTWTVRHEAEGEAASAYRVAEPLPRPVVDAEGAIRAVEPPRPAPQQPTARSKPAATGGGSCPQCGCFMEPEAVLCIDCGFNRKTGKQLRTVSKRFQRRWDTGRFPYLARLIVFVLLLPPCVAPFFYDEPVLGIAALAAWAVVLLPLLGTLKRITITRTSDGRAILIRKWWLCFIPCAQSTLDLGEYRLIRLRHQEGATSWRAVVETLLIAALLFLLCGLPGVLYALLRYRASTLTLEVAGELNVLGEPEVEPEVIYEGTSETIMRGVGDTLKEVAGLRYG